MNDRAVPDQFDTIVRDALADVARAAQPDPGLADLLIANAQEGRPAVTSLASHRAAKRWVAPLLAVASIVALAVGAAVLAKVVADHHHDARPLHRNTTPTPDAPKPPALPHFHAADVYFSDLQHGWALGDAKCASSNRTNCPALLATRDGGTSWRVLDLPKGLVSTFDSGSCGTNGRVAGHCVDAVLFANESDGYLWSLHTIYSTVDGGRTWSHYVDPTHAWDGATRMVVAGPVVVRIAPIQQCSSGCPGAVETAPVGTTQWQPSRPTTQQVGLYSSNLAVAGSDIYLFAGGTVANASPGIYRSTDGGNNWTRVAHNVCGVASSPEQDPFSGTGSGVADNLALVVSCLGSGAGTVRVAPPGSTSFAEPRRYPGNDTVVLEGAQSEQRVVVADTSHAYTGRHLVTTFYVTTDGGRSWRRTATLPVRGDGIRFRSGADGYAITQDGTALYVTDNGGQSWQRTQFSS
jgi:photosystem II stability/assembly factor-like uncharacterized protein